MLTSFYLTSFQYSFGKNTLPFDAQRKKVDDNEPGIVGIECLYKRRSAEAARLYNPRVRERNQNLSGITRYFCVCIFK